MKFLGKSRAVYRDEIKMLEAFSRIISYRFPCNLLGLFVADIAASIVIMQEADMSLSV